MPPKKEEKKPKKIDKTAQIDVDGATSKVGSMDISDEITQEEHKKAAYPSHWSDDSGDESYGKVGLTVRQVTKTWQVYGSHGNDRFYLPPAEHRSSMDEGNHIIPSAFIKFFISALERKNIKTLPQDFRRVLKTLLPERSSELDGNLEQLELQIKESRETRKELTSKVGLPHDRSNDEAQSKTLVERTKTRFISADKYDVQRKVEEIASRFLEIFEEENKCQNSRSGASGNQGEGPCLTRLITLQELLDYNGDINAEFLNNKNPQSSYVRGSDLKFFTDFAGDSEGNYRPKNNTHITNLSQKLTSLKNSSDRSIMIKGISECITQPFDYKRTKKSDVQAQEGGAITRVDDEALLYKSVARLIVVTFTSFDSIISKLTPDEKRTLYTTILSDVLTSNEWIIETKRQNEAGAKETLVDAHQVMDGTKKPIDIDIDILKRGVEKFAKIDFGNSEDENPIVIIKMRDPNDPNPAERPQEVLYCADRTVVVAPASSKKSTSGKKAAKSDFKADDSYDNIDALVSSTATPISSERKSKTTGSLFRTQSLPAKLEFDPNTEEKLKKVPKKLSKKISDSNETLISKPSTSPNTSDSETETLTQKANEKGKSGNTIG